MALTSQQFNKLATKEELKKEVSKLATKKDLKELRQESKKDLKELRQESKKDLKELRQETKSDFEKFAIRAFDTFATKEDIKGLATKNDLTEFKDEILTAVDGITKKYQEVDIGFVLNQGAHDRFEEKLLKQKKELELLKKN